MNIHTDMAEILNDVKMVAASHCAYEVRQNYHVN